MKYIFFILLLLFSVLISSCERDKDKIAKKSIIGTWNIDKIVSNGMIERNAGEITYTKNNSNLTSTYSATNEIYEAESTINGTKTQFQYEFFQGGTDMILNHYNGGPNFNSVFIEMFTKNMLIYFTSSSGIQTKYYLSK